MCAWSNIRKIYWTCRVWFFWMAIMLLLMFFSIKTLHDLKYFIVIHNNVLRSHIRYATWWHGQHLYSVKYYAKYTDLYAHSNTTKRIFRLFYDNPRCNALTWSELCETIFSWQRNFSKHFNLTMQYTQKKL